MLYGFFIYIKKFSNIINYFISCVFGLSSVFFVCLFVCVSKTKTHINCNIYLFRLIIFCDLLFEVVNFVLACLGNLKEEAVSAVYCCILCKSFIKE